MNALTSLADFVAGHRGLLVLTGAGISTPSGIPAYRDVDRQWRRSQPVLAAEFRSRAGARQRYWARSLVGWPRFDAAQPNVVHHAIRALTDAGWFGGLITQNVDGLHQRAGHRDVVELHGALRRVVCLDCAASFSRAEIHERLVVMNPWFAADRFDDLALPDGDADLPDEAVAEVAVPACAACGGVLKPQVIFFGDNVRKETVAAVNARVSQAPALLVLGSSLTVFSSFRICRQFATLERPIVIVNRGATRADNLAALKLDEPVETVLPALVELLHE